MSKLRLSPGDFHLCVPLISLRNNLLAYEKNAERRFLSDSEVEVLLTILSLGRVACLEVPHVITLASRAPTERANVPFGGLGSVCGVAHRLTPHDNTASEFYAPFIALPLSTRSHFSVLIVDPGDQRAYHFDSMPGLHNDMLDNLLKHNWPWMMPTAAGEKPTIEQLRERTTRLYHRQTRDNCGVVVARVVRQLEMRMGEMPHDFAVASRRPALMQNIFELVVADDDAVDAYRIRLAEAIDDFVTLHVATGVLSADVPTTESPLRALMPPGITATAAMGYTRKERVEANLLMSWLRARFVWFQVFSTLSAASLVQVLNSGMPALFVNCNADGTTVFGATLIVPPCGTRREWTIVGTTLSACLTVAPLPALLHDIADERRTFATAYIREQMDRLTPLLIGVAAPIDARLWNAGSNQRGWVAAHGAETALQLTAALNAASDKISAEQRERNTRLSDMVANGCYGLLARQMHEHVRRRLTEAEKRALASEGLNVGVPARSEKPDPLEARRLVLRRRQDDFIEKLRELSMPQLELCYNDASSVYNHVANTPAVLSLVSEVATYVADTTDVGLALSLLYDIVAMLSHAVPVLWARRGDPRDVIYAVHADMILPMLNRRAVPVFLPVYVFYWNELPPVVPVEPPAHVEEDDDDDCQMSYSRARHNASEEPAVPVVPREQCTFKGIWSLPNLLRAIASGEVAPSPHVPMLSEMDAATVVKMLGTCIMWPSASDARPTGSIEFGAFVSGITAHPALTNMQCHEGRYPWICLEVPSALQH